MAMDSFRACLAYAGNVCTLLHRPIKHQGNEINTISSQIGHIIAYLIYRGYLVTTFVSAETRNAS